MIITISYLPPPSELLDMNIQCTVLHIPLLYRSTQAYILSFCLYNTSIILLSPNMIALKQYWHKAL